MDRSPSPQSSLSFRRPSPPTARAPQPPFSGRRARLRPPAPRRPYPACSPAAQAPPTSRLLPIVPSICGLGRGVDAGGACAGSIQVEDGRWRARGSQGAAGLQVHGEFGEAGGNFGVIFVISLGNLVIERTKIGREQRGAGIFGSVSSDLLERAGFLGLPWWSCSAGDSEPCQMPKGA
ncbi:hypothetical protein SEVIR_8G099200v4 [Setaria viridis]|uniref:Uncharacterized protein n=1 Tax=Setaria viridis TaxID=4556 RepID=A0A4U6TDS9_SETVI|nr:hypothetical protein SEVIR_8G099200v2 [Setaria viridis]